MKNISISLGSFNRASVELACEVSRNGISVPFLGNIGIPVIQICPQNRTRVNEAIIDKIAQDYPGHEIAFHANIHVLGLRAIKDIIDFSEDDPYWIRFKELANYAQIKNYSAHVGFRKYGSMIDVFDKQKRMMDFLEIDVAIEGHYPVSNNRFLASDWTEWEMMLNSGLPFVVDVSHAAIIANLGGLRNDNLVQAMLSSKNCMEIHLSGNDGVSDQHRELDGNEWWWPMLPEKNSESRVFYEGFFDVKSLLGSQ